jgi:transposase
LEEKSVRLHQQRVELYHQIQDLAAKKVDVASIARQLGVSRQTVYTYLKMKQPPARTRIPREREKFLDPYKDYLVRRWNEGCRNAHQMYREIKEQGYTGSESAVGRFVAPGPRQKRQGPQLQVRRAGTGDDGQTGGSQEETASHGSPRCGLDDF